MSWAQRVGLVALHPGEWIVSGDFHPSNLTAEFRSAPRHAGIVIGPIWLAALLRPRQKQASDPNRRISSEIRERSRVDHGGDSQAHARWCSLTPALCQGQS
jgi:hypothetical protein